ncbi:MAG TPA: hypothetical protein VK864_11855, partial [Longimicrobiales bacterium]|nr:hypothetical protein [Longimicrobiales bacterium]
MGINAGVQPEPGIYLADRFLFYSASTITNRDGEALPVVGLDIDARSNVFGVSATLKPKGAPYFTVAAGVPLASISLNST